MKGKSIIIAFVFVFFFIITDVAKAQSISTKSPIWFSVGGGLGWNTTDTVADEGLTGGAGYIRIGTSLSDWIGVGAEIIGRVRDAESEDGLGRINVTGVIMVPISGYFFSKGGLGGALVGDEDDGMGFSGLGATVGLGNNFKITNFFSMTLNVDFLIQKVSNPEWMKGTNSELLLTLGLSFD